MSNTPVIRTIREQITSSIRADVISGVLGEGVSLREQSLATQYGVSRAPIRDALLQLTHEGLLVAKPNCGVRVASTATEEIQPLVVGLRRDIELYALDKVFDKLTDVDVERLGKTVENLRASCEKNDLSGMVENDMALHRYLIDLTGNSDLLAMWLPIVSRMLLHYSRHCSLLDTHVEHMRIVNAIQRRDKQATQQALLDNIQ